MNKVVNKFMRLLIVILFFSAPVLLCAQDPGGFDDDVIDNPVPFDGGLSLLVAAGVGYGLKKAHDKRKADRAEKEK